MTIKRWQDIDSSDKIDAIRWSNIVTSTHAAAFEALSRFIALVDVFVGPDDDVAALMTRALQYQHEQARGDENEAERRLLAAAIQYVYDCQRKYEE